MSGTVDGKKWCLVGNSVCYLVYCWTKTPWHNFSLLFCSSMRKEGCGCHGSASFSAEKHFPFNLSGVLFSHIPFCLENRQSTLKKPFQNVCFQPTTGSLSPFSLSIWAHLKMLFINKTLATVCIDFHFGKVHSNAHMWWNDANLFPLWNTVNEMAGCWPRKAKGITTLPCCHWFFLPIQTLCLYYMELYL